MAKKNATTCDAPLLVSRERAADLLGVSIRTLQRLTNSGELPAVRFGTGGRKVVRYKVSDLETFCTKSRTVAGA